MFPAARIGILILRTIRWLPKNLIWHRLVYRLIFIPSGLLAYLIIMIVKIFYYRDLKSVEIESGNDHERKNQRLEDIYRYHSFYSYDFSKKKSLKEVIIQWLQTEHPLKRSFDPYPTSQRISIWFNEFGRTIQNDGFVRAVLILQIFLLLMRIEKHLGGNHVLVNYKGIIFGSALLRDRTFFRGVLLWGVGKYLQNLDKQINNDGGHFERSPSYHYEMMKDAFDIYLLVKQLPGPGFTTASLLLKTRVIDLWNFYDGISRHGLLPFFNDTNGRHQIESERLHPVIARELGIGHTVLNDSYRMFEDTGFFRYSSDQYWICCDVGTYRGVGQPGHAHASSLSFEVRDSGGKRLLGNCGVSTYTPGTLRDFQRSTRACSTIQIDNRSSSEPWAAFRLADRCDVEAMVSVLDGEFNISLVSSHDGYAPAIHLRRWHFSDDRFELSDHILGPYDSAISRIYFASDVVVRKVDRKTIKVDESMIIKLLDFQDFEIENCSIFNHFGQASDSLCLKILPMLGVIRIEFNFLEAS